MPTLRHCIYTQWKEDDWQVTHPQLPLAQRGEGAPPLSPRAASAAQATPCRLPRAIGFQVYLVRF